MKNIAKYIIISSIIINSFIGPYLSLKPYNNSNTLFVKVAYAQLGDNDNSSNETNTSTQTSQTKKIDETKVSESPPGGYLSCGGFYKFDIPCHIINFFHAIFITAGNFLVGASAIFMDFFLSHSIQSDTYKSQNFISQGWEIIRDITNIIFIFALIMIAFNLVLGSGDYIYKKSN